MKLNKKTAKLLCTCCSMILLIVSIISMHKSYFLNSNYPTIYIITQNPVPMLLFMASIVFWFIWDNID